jgi:hypothetical protein
MKKKRLDISRCLSPQYWASCTFNRGAATPPTAYGFVLVGSVDPKQKSDEDAIYIRGRATPLVEEVINNMNCWQAPVFHADRKSHAGMEHRGNPLNYMVQHVLLHWRSLTFFLYPAQGDHTWHVIFKAQSSRHYNMEVNKAFVSGTLLAR